MTTGMVGHAETFDVGDPLKTTSTDYKTDCLSCHLPASDWIYVQGYPSLKR